MAAKSFGVNKKCSLLALASEFLIYLINYYYTIIIYGRYRSAAPFFKRIVIAISAYEVRELVFIFYFLSYQQFQLFDICISFYYFYFLKLHFYSNLILIYLQSAPYFICR